MRQRQHRQHRQHICGLLSAVGLLTHVGESFIASTRAAKPYVHPKSRRWATGTDPDNNTRFEFDVEAARDKLLWEIIAEQEERPVLNLSARDEDGDLSLSEAAATATEVQTLDVAATTDTFCWEDGRLWAETREGIAQLGISLDETKVLGSVPQIARLEPSMVLSTAKSILDAGVAPSVLESEPRLLSFREDDVRYGLEFLQKMMAATQSAAVIVACNSAPALFLGAVEGGLQERAVKRSLAAAGEATDGANKRIAGDAAVASRELKKFRRKGM